MSHAANAKRLPWYGLIFAVILALLLVLAVMSYTGAFRSTRDVTMYADQGGNQLSLGAQVKLHGVVVGTVTDMGVSGDRAKLTLGLDTSFVRDIPSNVEARILPKTLIGQDYIDLIVPAQASSTRIAVGDVIGQDRTATAVELETALNNLLVTLHDVPPQKLVITLNALASSLNGRGAELGRTLTTLQRYLGGLNPVLPTAIADMKALTMVSKTYNRAAPHLLDALKSFTTTARTLVAQQANLDLLYRQVTGAADTTTAFLQANGDNLISLVATSRRTLRILATYAPEYPCLLSQLAGLVPRVDKAFGKGTARPALHVLLQVSPGRGKYIPGRDKPAYADTRGPRCYPIMRLAPQYPDGVPINDGSYAPPSSAKGVSLSGSALAGAATVPNSTAESNLIGRMFGGQGGSAPSFASLLLGPILRGSQVSVR